MAHQTFNSMLSVFDSAEEEAEHTAWLRAKLQASIDDPRPSIPHEQVMAEIRERLAKRRAAKNLLSSPGNIDRRSNDQERKQHRQANP